MVACASPRRAYTVANSGVRVHEWSGLVIGALELEPDEREDWLRAAAGGDRSLFEEALRLLEPNERSIALEPDGDADWVLG